MNIHPRFTALILACLSAAAPAAETVKLPDGPCLIELRVHRTAVQRGDQVTVALGERRRLALVIGPDGVNVAGTRPDWVARGVGLADGGDSLWRLARLPDRVTLHRDGVPVLLHRATPDGGTVTVQTSGATAEVAVVQPLESVFATDDFLRAPGKLGDWLPRSGQWAIREYRDPLVAKYKLPAQATWFAGEGAPALAVTGDEAWCDTRAAVDLRLESGRAGVVFAAGEGGYGLLRAGAGRLELVAVGPAGERVLAGAPLALEPESWQRLWVESSADQVRAGVNGRALLTARSPGLFAGRAGCWCDGRAGFDNFRVEPVRLVADSFDDPEFTARCWRATGPWRPRGKGAVASWPVSAGQPSRLTSGLGLEDGGELTARLSLPADGEAGCATDGARVTLTRQGAGLWWRVVSPAGEQTGALAGPAGALHEVSIRRRGPGFEAVVDGQRQVTWYDTAGPVGCALTVLGPGGAVFDQALVRDCVLPPAAEVLRADLNQLTVPGKLKSATLRVLGDLLKPSGRVWRHPSPQSADGGQLIGEPAGAPIELWTDPVPGDAGLRVALNELAPGATLTLLLNKQDGYALALEPGGARLLRGDRTVGKIALEAPVRRARLWRDREWVAAEVDGRRAAWRDPAPPPSGPVGVRLAGGRAKLGAFEVTAENAVATTFQVVDTAWRQDGPWLWSTGMACIPWSYWITGDGRQRPTWLWRRDPLGADVAARVYLCEYTDGYDDEQAAHDHEHHPLHDVSLVLDADGGDPDSGYRFVVGADGGRCARLLRAGKLVAENRAFTIRMGGHCNEPRSLLVEATRIGNRLKLVLNGRTALDFTDPQPLPGGGYVGLGVADSRANFGDFAAFQPALGDPS